MKKVNLNYGGLHSTLTPTLFSTHPLTYITYFGGKAQHTPEKQRRSGTQRRHFSLPEPPASAPPPYTAAILPPQSHPVLDPDETVLGFLRSRFFLLERVATEILLSIGGGGYNLGMSFTALAGEAMITEFPIGEAVASGRDSGTAIERHLLNGLQKVKKAAFYPSFTLECDI